MDAPDNDQLTYLKSQIQLSVVDSLFTVHTVPLSSSSVYESEKGSSGKGNN